MSRFTLLCVGLLAISHVATANKSKEQEQQEGVQPALPLSLTGYEALEAQEQMAGLGLGAAAPRLMEQLNLNAGIPSSSSSGYAMAQPEYAGTPSILTQTSEHLFDRNDVVTATQIGGSNAGAVTGTDERFTEKEGDGEKNSMQANLEIALEEIKHDIVVKSKQVMEEKAWVSQVREIMQQYELKVQRVEQNINTLRTEVKTLYKKKRQIENLMLQEKLDAKLNDAKADLRTLDNALMHVKNKERSFEKNKQDVATTVSAIKEQLNKLRGLAPGTVDPDEEEEAAPEAEA